VSVTVTNALKCWKADLQSHSSYSDSGTVPIRALIRVENTDPGDTVSKIELFADGEVTATDEATGVSRTWEFDWPAKPGKHFCFTKVTQADGNMLWSAPIWLTRAAG
jgi:hypothetical protein